MSQYQTAGNPLLGLPSGPPMGVRQDIAYPSEIIDNRGGMNSADEPPCNFCGYHRLSGPEGDSWNPEHHCWKCGYRPDVTTGIGEHEMRQQFDAFRNWLASQTAQDNAHPTLQPPPNDEAEISRMQNEIEDMQNKLAARMSPGGVTPNQTVMRPGG